MSPCRSCSHTHRGWRSLVLLVAVCTVTGAACTVDSERPTGPSAVSMRGTAGPDPCALPPATSDYRRPAPAEQTELSFAGPLSITEGGTYAGNWQSLDPDVAAVTIRTDEPVIIAGAHLRSRGHLIRGVVDGIDLSVTDTAATALNPARNGEVPGRFVKLRNASRVLLEHNSLTGTSGIRLEGYSGDHEEESFRIMYNRATNIDGRRSTGSGFRSDDATARLVQFVQLVNVRSVPSVEIAWNDVRNQPGRSRVEDVINVYMSSGTPASPIMIHDNFIDGAYPTNPASDDYSGGGIMLGDSSDRGLNPANVVARRNVVFNTTNYGVGVAAGHRMWVADNCVLASGRLENGTRLGAQNVGIYVQDFYRRHEMENIEVTGNVVRWQRPKRGDQNNLWLPDATTVAGNTPYSGTVDASLLDREYSAWHHRTRQQNITIGPVT